MIIHIPPKDSYFAPAGTFPAVCSEAKEYAKPIKGTVERFIRLIFVLKTNAPRGTRYKVAKNYPLKDLSELYHDLETWLGEGIRGKPLDLDRLQGEDAVVTVAHSHNEQFAEPFRFLTQILPPEEPVQEAA